MPALARSQRGKKRRACKRCHRLKRACDLGVPCGACEEKASECSYASLREIDVDSPGDQGWTVGPITPDCNTPIAVGSSEVSGCRSLIDTDQSEDDHALASEMLTEHSATDAETAASSFQLALHPWLHEHAENLLVSSKTTLVDNLSFLLTFTSTTGFVESFECGSTIDRTLIQSAYLSKIEESAVRLSEDPAGTAVPSAHPEQDAFAFNDRALAFLLSGVPWPGWQGELCALDSKDAHGVSDSFVEREKPRPSIASMPPQAEFDALSGKSADIVAILRTTPRRHSEQGVTPRSTCLDHDCARFFSPFNLGRFLALFWSSWYPNCPIVHRPTFLVSSVSAELIAAMVVVGACLSPDDGDRAAARVWFDGVERMVFGRREFSEDLVVAADEDTELCYDRLEALQAAYFVCLYQSWEGSKFSRQRARRQRYTQVIAVSPLHVILRHASTLQSLSSITNKIHCSFREA